MKILVSSPRKKSKNQIKNQSKTSSHRTISLKMTGGIKIKFGDKLRRIVIINPVRKLKMNLEISAIST
jgi:hypothetical protein